MDSYMESDYVMQFKVYDSYHDITKTHVIYIKEPDMKPHGCSAKNPSSIRAHVIIMKFLEEICEYFKDNKISCRMNDVLDVLFNSAPGILRSPTITLTNYDFNYHSNRYQSIQFILEDKQVYYSESFYILAVIDHDIKPGEDIYTEEKLRELMASNVAIDPNRSCIRDPLLAECCKKIDDEIQAYLNDESADKSVTEPKISSEETKKSIQKYLGIKEKGYISKAALNELVATRLVLHDQAITTKDDTNRWDNFLNEKKMERLHKDDDKIKYFCAPLEILDKIDNENCDSVVMNYTAGTDGDAIQRGSILLTASITKYNLSNGRVEISINSAIANYMKFLVIAVIVISHDGNMKKWAICKFK